MKAAWSNPFTSQGKPRIADHHQKLGESHAIKLSLMQDSRRNSRRNQPVDNIIFRLLTSRTMRECISIVLSQPGCGNLLRYSQEATTRSFSRCI